MKCIECFAENLRKYWKMRGLTQDQLAFESGIDRTYLQLLESKKANPSLKIIENLADVLKISVNDFFLELRK
jgi:transcriptional regulator with XRE-family HTH domain